MGHLANVLGCAVLALALAGCERGGVAASTAGGTGKRLVVLGIDGMDPDLATRYMEAGRMPNLSALAKSGTFGKLATSSPPESPVAWSDFITSQHSDRHGIYDFVHRDPKTMQPYLSTSRVTPPTTVLHLGPWMLPLGGGQVELLRAGRPFWSYLDDAGIPSTMLMIPAVYPPGSEGHAQVMAGMGTPDLLGTYGVFQLYTNDPSWKDREVAGGQIHSLAVQRGHTMELDLFGPPSPFSAEGALLKSPFELVVDADHPAAFLKFGDEERVLVAGEWSDWIPVSFDPGLASRAVRGMVRVFLKSVDPFLVLYVSPLNLDPKSPAQPFATPGFAERMAANVGRFHTLGIPEDEKALESGALSDDDYLRLVDDIFRERVRMIDHCLDEFSTGLLFTYVGTIDQASHAYFRTMGSDAPEDLRRLSNTIPDLYARVDELIGHVVTRVGPGTPVVVMSDHGFAHYTTKFNLNTWLRQNGYLVEKTDEGESKNPLDRIDWTKTRAYGLGINLLYLNMRGREPQGVVAPDERDALISKIKGELEALKDPMTREHPIAAVHVTKPGAFPDRTPDAVVGYARGYRASDATAVGALTATVFEKNEDKWRGDHCMDAAAVPGLFASTLSIDASGAALVDVGPTILEYFGVRAPSTFVGKSLFQKRSHP